MTMLTKIGNSKGIRIPKSLIAQAHLENVELDLEVVENGLLIKPIVGNKRQNWEQNIQNVLSINKESRDEAFISELLDDSDLEEFQW